MTKRILEKRMLSENVCEMKIHAPLIAEERLAGQFIILSVTENFGERIPLTIADADPKTGSITLIFQLVGRTTRDMAKMEVGDYLAHLVGPLGTPTHIENFGHVVCVGGGIGVAPMYPIAQALKKAGNHLTIIMGARNKALLIMEEEMRAIADELIICTDDGSAGRKCLVTVPLKEQCEKENKPDFAILIGPPVMMKFCAQTTQPYQIHTMASLNSIMVDGTGMCGGCRVTVGGKTKFVCVDGPEFNAHEVDFNNLMSRLNAYKTQEVLHADGSPCHLEQLADQKEKTGSN